MPSTRKQPVTSRAVTGAPAAPPHQTRWLWGFRRSALIELAVFLGLLLAADRLFFDGTRYWDLSPHPFWIVVLLLSAQYGTREGLLAAALSSCALLAGNLPSWPVTVDAYSYFANLSRHPVLWFVASLVLGEIRQRHIRERDQLRARLEEAAPNEELIAGSHERLSRAKEKLEGRLASQMKSLISVYETAKEIERLQTSEVLVGVVNVVRSALNPEQFSLYLLRDSALEFVLQEGWEHGSARYAHVFHPESPLFREVVARQRVVCCVRAEDEEVLRGEGVLAGPLLAETGEVVGMLKIESMGFADLNLPNVQAFRVLCEWIGATYANARKYQEAREHSFLNADTSLYSFQFLQRQTDFLIALSKRFGFDLTLFVLRLENGQELDEPTRSTIPATLGSAMHSRLRRTDLVFDYQRTGLEFAFILPGNNVENTQILVDKIIADMKMGIPEARFSATTLALHEAHPEVGRFVQEILPRHYEVMSRVVSR
jgi:polysaccharide biosynthesis protein PelD